MCETTRKELTRKELIEEVMFLDRQYFEIVASMECNYADGHDVYRTLTKAGMDESTAKALIAGITIGRSHEKGNTNG